MNMPSLGYSEVLDFLGRQTSEDVYQIAYGLVHDGGSWRLLNCAICFLGSANREPVEYIYDQVVLVREVRQGGLVKRLREIVESKSFQIQRRDERFSVEEPLTMRDEIQHVESGREGAYPRDPEWPYFGIEMTLANRNNRWISETIASEHLPVFPGRDAAMNYLTGFKKDDWYNLPGVLAPLQDLRGRIDRVDVDESKIRIHVGSLKLKSSDLAVKVYAASEKDFALLEATEPSLSGNFEIEVKEPPTSIGIALLEKGSGMLIDAAEWSPQRPSRKFEVRSGTGLEALVTQGESETVEYKVEIDRNDKEEFTETLSSFANTGNGVIVLGVSDQLEVVGTERKKEDIARTIDSLVDPIPPYRIEETNYRAKRLLLVYVEKGKYPPYVSQKTKKVYGRRRGNDYFLSSTEIRNLVLASEHARSWA